MHGAVYHPPKAGLPYLAVIINSNTSEVVVSRSVSSIQEGQRLIEQVFTEFAEAKNNGEI